MSAEVLSLAYYVLLVVCKRMCGHTCQNIIISYEVDIFNDLFYLDLPKRSDLLPQIKCRGSFQ